MSTRITLDPLADGSVTVRLSPALNPHGVDYLPGDSVTAERVGNSVVLTWGAARPPAGSSLLLCDACYERAYPAAVAACDEDCARPLDHAGTCSGSRRGGGDECERCGTVGRLHLSGPSPELGFGIGTRHLDHVWIVNTSEVEGLYVFEDEDPARAFANRYPDASVTEEIVMDDAEAARFLRATADPS